MLMDFGDVDREDIIRKYNGIMEKENLQRTKKSLTGKEENIVKNIKNQTKIGELLGRKPMASSITITPLE